DPARNMSRCRRLTVMRGVNRRGWSMDVSPDEVAAELKQWLAESWDPELSLVEWRTCLLESGWAVPSWAPRWHGRGLPSWADDLAKREIDAFGAVGLPPGAAVGLVAPTLMAHGSDELRDRFLRPIITGEHRWCQLFSEPGAGSDLAGLT